jgi:hypothetical protein
VEYITSRIAAAQDFLKVPIALENTSQYLFWEQSNLNELSFLQKLTHASGCQILFDVNNFIVNKHHNGLNSLSVKEINLISQLPIVQFHVAGYRNEGDAWVDDHGREPSVSVCDLSNSLKQFFPTAPFILEWDKNIPEAPIILNAMVKIEESLMSAQKNINQADSYSPTNCKTSAEVVASCNKADADFKWETVQNHFLKFVSGKNETSDFLKNSSSESNLENENKILDWKKGKRIYRTNMVFGAVELLQNELPGLFEKIGENNFKFFVREWLDDENFQMASHTGANSALLAQSFFKWTQNKRF